MLQRHVVLRHVNLHHMSTRRRRLARPVPEGDGEGGEAAEEPSLAAEDTQHRRRRRGLRERDGIGLVAYRCERERGKKVRLVGREE